MPSPVGKVPDFNAFTADLLTLHQATPTFLSRNIFYLQLVITKG